MVGFGFGPNFWMGTCRGETWLLETRFREKNIYSSHSWSAPKFLRPDEAFGTTTVVPPSLPLTYPLPSIFSFLSSTRNSFRGDNAAIYSRFDNIFSAFTSTPIFSTELSNSEGTAPEDFGFRFRPPQVSMDTSLYSTTKRIAVIRLPLHFASF